jgi:hypothetical protein
LAGICEFGETDYVPSVPSVYPENMNEGQWFVLAVEFVWDDEFTLGDTFPELTLGDSLQTPQIVGNASSRVSTAASFLVFAAG